MVTQRDFVRVLIVFVLESAFLYRCSNSQVEYQKECYKTICFFRPESQYRWVTWQDAMQTCRRNQATLPTILNEAHQIAFESYMNFLKLVDKDDFWMAGREVREIKWKWLNGRISSQLQEDFRDDFVQGILTNEMLYTTDIPSSYNHFVCQLSGNVCRWSDATPLSNGCLFIGSRKTMNLYEARNQCVNDGGDLAVLEHPDDLYRVREMITRIENVTNVWIGLRRQWWDWSGTDIKQEVKYSNWLPSNGFKSNQTCMLSNMNGYKWQQEPCSSMKLFVCQTGPPIIVKTPTTAVPPSTISGRFIPFIVFAGVGVFIAVFLFVIVKIVKKERRVIERETRAQRATSDRSYQDLHDRQENQYTGLQGISLQQNGLNQDNQSPPPNYDDVVVTRYPNYLNIIE